MEHELAAKLCSLDTVVTGAVKKADKCSVEENGRRVGGRGATNLDFIDPFFWSWLRGCLLVSSVLSPSAHLAVAESLSETLCKDCVACPCRSGKVGAGLAGQWPGFLPCPPDASFCEDLIPGSTPGAHEGFTYSLPLRFGSGTFPTGWCVEGYSRGSSVQWGLSGSVDLRL